MEFLFKNTVGAIDDIAVKEFWLNYLIRREELKAINDKPLYSPFKEWVEDLNFDLREKLKEEVELFGCIYDLVKPQK